MTDDDPEPNDPLSPYHPSRVPAVPGEGRRWVAILLVLLLVVGAVAGGLSLLFPF